MGLRQYIQRAVGAMNIRLPFVQMVGFEKTYGKTPPKDQAQQVAEYKSWVYACVNRNAFSIAKTDLWLHKRSMTPTGEELQQIFDHPWLELLKNVNPFFNKFELWTLTATFLELTGNAYWWMPKTGLGIPGAIWNLPAHWVRVVPSETKFISGYVVRVPGKEPPIPFDETEIVHFKYPSPFDMYYGTSPTLASAYGIDLNNHIKEWGINFMGNNAQPSGVLSTEDSLTEDQYNRLRDQWNRKHRGTGKAGKMALLEAGLKYQQTGSSMKDMEFKNINEGVRNEILACFGVPASKLGLVEDVNRANAEANDYTYQKETILPRLKLIEEKINEKIMPIYDTSLIVQFDNPVPEDKEFRLRETTEHLASGYSAIDDERVEDDREPYDLPETIVPLITMAKIPAGTPEAEPTDPNQIPPEDDEDATEDENTDKKGVVTKGKRDDRKWRIFSAVAKPQERHFADIMRKYFEDQHSEVMRNINKFKSMTKDPLTQEVLFNDDEQDDKLEKISYGVISVALLSGIDLGVQDLGLMVEPEIAVPQVQRVLAKRVEFFAKKVNEATSKLLATELSLGIDAGESIDDISKRVDKVFGFSEKYRSVRVAQTEVIGAMNAGKFETYKEAGVKVKKWITSRDEKVRDSHKSMDNQEKPLLNNFITGAGSGLLYPGDRSTGAPAGELINCRCTFTAVR